MTIKFNPLRDIFLVIVATSTIFYFFTKRKTNLERTIEEEYLLFNSASIKGRLTNIGFAYDMESFTVDNLQHEFVFNPEINKEGNYFHAATQKGDSIIKLAYDSILTVKSKDSIYKYNFKRY